MTSIHFKTQIDKGNNIPLPEGITIPIGPAEVIIIPQASNTSEQPEEGVPRVPQIAVDLARLAEEYKDQFALPGDYAVNHDHYLHGSPKWIDLK
jgi:hypothetical protein